MGKPRGKSFKRYKKKIYKKIAVRSLPGQLSNESTFNIIVEYQ